MDTGFFDLGTVNSIVGTFDPATDTIVGLTVSNPFTTFISEDAGEGGLFDRNLQSVYWIQESGGNITLRYSIVPEADCWLFLAGAGLVFGERRRRRQEGR